MKIEKKKLNEVIDNYLQSELLQERKQLLSEQSGTNTMVSWRMPGVGQECQLNIASLLEAKGMPTKAAKNLNDGISYILSRFMGANSWMCDIINIGLEVPRAVTDATKTEAPTTNIIKPWLTSLTVSEWEKTIYEDVVNAKDYKAALHGEGSDSVYSKIKDIFDDSNASKQTSDVVIKFIKKLKGDLLDDKGDNFDDAILKITNDSTAKTALSELLYCLTDEPDAKEALTSNTIATSSEKTTAIAVYKQKLKDKFGI